MKEKQEKKAIALIYDPHNLLQFIWYYCSYGTDYEWTALCLPNGHKGEYMSKYCKRSGIFEKVISDTTSFLMMSTLKKVPFFLQMLGYAIFGKQISFCEKMVKRNVPIDSFELAVVLTDVGIVSGAYIGLGKNKRVVILEDGYGDYAERSNKYIQSHLFNLTDWQGYFVSKMGYANPAHYFPLKTTAYCEKFCSKPDKMNYKEYKSIKKLYDFSGTNMDLYSTTISRTYGKIEKYDFANADTVIFTDPIYDYVKEIDAYVERFQNYIVKECKNVILKRHPRDDVAYSFGDSVIVQEIDHLIPAEVLLPYIKGKKIYFFDLSSIILYMDSELYDLNYLYFKGLYEASENENSYMKYVEKEKMSEDLKRFGLTDMELLEI